MNRTPSVVVVGLASAFALALLVSPDIAAAERVCVSRSVKAEFFALPYTQHEALTSLALEHGAENVQTAVAAQTNGVPKRYLVFVRGCDSYAPRGEHPTQSPRITREAVIIPEHSPYEWAEFETAAGAHAEYDAHASAGARGIVTIGDGSFVVYWSRTVSRDHD